MQSKPQQPSNRHHYVPEFLLKQWKNSDGAIWRYFRNGRGAIDCRAQAPAGMGYQPGLYATDGLPPEHRQQVESKFMAPLDTEASRVHQLLLGGRVRALTDEQCSRWAGLMMSLWFRTPSEVEGIRTAVHALYQRHLASTALNPDGPTELPEAALNSLAMDAMMESIEDSRRDTELINMHWDVIEVGGSRELFISDSPLSQPTSFARLGAPGSYLALPISPTKLFVAARSPTLVAGMRKLPQRELVARQNRAAVSQAEHFVGTRSRSADKFIRENFGTSERFSLIGSIVEKYRADSGASSDT